MSAEITHIPVALERCVQLLTPALINKSKTYLIDATLGLGGHARAFLESFTNLHLIGIDREIFKLSKLPKQIYRLIKSE